jgi:hypothetical protein
VTVTLAACKGSSWTESRHALQVVVAVKYYRVHLSDDESLGVAKSRSPGLFMLQAEGEVVGWEPVALDLVEGDFSDYLASNLGVRLCSERMKEVLQRFAGPRDVLQWLPVRVFKGEDERQFFILHLPILDDVLGSKTLFHEDVVIKPVLSLRRALGHAVFSYRGSEGVSLFIDERVRKALSEAGCSGAKYSLALSET